MDSLLGDGYGTQKPIETIVIVDEVLAYDPETEDGLDSLKPARVARTMTNLVVEIIDFHGVKVTPGHATLYAGNGALKSGAPTHAGMTVQ